MPRCDATWTRNNNNRRCPQTAVVEAGGRHLCANHSRAANARSECGICMEPLTRRSRVDACGHGHHFFHRDCLVRWGCCASLDTFGRCPTCRQVLSPIAAKRVYEHDDRARQHRMYHLAPPVQVLLKSLIDNLVVRATIGDVASVWRAWSLSSTTG